MVVVEQVLMTTASPELPSASAHFPKTSGWGISCMAVWSRTICDYSHIRFRGWKFCCLDIPLPTTCHSPFPLLDKGALGTVGPSKGIADSFLSLVLVKGIAEVWEGFWLVTGWMPETSFSGQEGARWPVLPCFQHIGFLSITMTGNIRLPMSKQLAMELKTSHGA